MRLPITSPALAAQNPCWTRTLPTDCTSRSCLNVCGDRLLRRHVLPVTICCDHKWRKKRADTKMQQSHDDEAIKAAADEAEPEPGGAGLTVSPRPQAPTPAKSQHQNIRVAPAVLDAA